MKITRRTALSAIAGTPAVLLSGKSLAQQPSEHPELNIAPGPFKGTRESLREWQVPEWYRDAKFGIWAHWGPQSGIEYGDWYARNMYIQGSRQYEYHVKVYGHPTKVGYKDVIPTWKAAKFDPDHLLGLYKKPARNTSAAWRCTTTNFDLWNSKYQPHWNSVVMGPKRDVVAAFKKAAANQGLRFAVSEHLAPSYHWLSTSHMSDKTGPLAGAPYDGANPAYADLYHKLPRDYPYGQPINDRPGA